ncbi:MAG: DUF4153 domain-containing protein [Desulfotomaculaceae bacterium]|nr:DUF4153 domain-containing protein [Desulfotomaculaceae bacterium]
MSAFTRSISQIFKGAARAFQTFPAANASALGFAIVTMIRIQLDWPQQEAYNFLFNCLHWAFALGAVFSLAAITAAQSRCNKARSFLMANLLGAVAVAATFLLLYLFGGTDPALDASRITRVSDLAAARVTVALLVSLLAFIILAGYPKDQSDFARSLFMTQKAFFIALIYGGVIMAGASGVAGAIQALLYRGMSMKVYEYIGTLVGFLAFTIFVGYFPDFRKGQVDEKREVAQKQPRFIEVLFGYIMIPIALAMTAVLLVWAGKTIVTGVGSSFLQLYGIATSYAVGGLWLHIMVTRHESGQAIFYRRFYPIAALVILAFEAWALLIQLSGSGLKMTEYTFILIWIVAAAASVLLLILKDKAHTAIAALISVAAIFAVLQVVGYQALPVKSQVHRLENLLVSQAMLKDGQLIPAASEPERALRASITDAVNYLAYAEDAKLPVWFDKHLGESSTFKTKLGFEQTWPLPEDDYINMPGGYKGLSLILQPGAVDISDYRWMVSLQDYSGKGNASATINGDKGLYRINWTPNTPPGIPVLRVELDNRVILERDMNAYIDQLTAAFPPGREGPPTQADLKDMSLQLETPEVTVLLVFNNIGMNVDPGQDRFNYYFNLSALYLKEKP